MIDTFSGMKWSPVYIIITTISTYIHSQQRIIEGPTDTRVLIGSTALLKCRIEAQVCLFKQIVKKILLKIAGRKSFHQLQDTLFQQCYF